VTRRGSSRVSWQAHLAGYYWPAPRPSPAEARASPPDPSGQLAYLPPRERRRAAHVYRPRGPAEHAIFPPPPCAQREARIQMSSLPQIRDEAGAVARLQNSFPVVHKKKLGVTLRSWGGGNETTPMRPWNDRNNGALDIRAPRG
jgi:hypothetical protein